MPGSAELPAIHGGDPVRPEGPPPWPRADDEIEAALRVGLATGVWGQYRGENLPNFESELGAFLHVPHVQTCASGTLAVEIALRALRVAPGDEVILAAYEYESNFLTIHTLGAKPVLVDVLRENWNMDPAAVEAAITPQTRAILCSHLHGGLINMRAIQAIAAARKLPVVEDAAQATGASIDGRMAGTWGDIGTMSFGGSKLLSAGRGGAVFTSDAQLNQRIKVALHRGVQPWAAMSELQAIVLRPQLERLNERNQERARRVAMLSKGLPPGLRLFRNSLEACSPAYYKVGFDYDSKAFGLSRERFVASMRAEGIAFDAGFGALHIGRSPSRFRAAGPLTNATAAHDRCVMLHHPVLSGSDADLNQVIAAAQKLYRHARS